MELLARLLGESVADADEEAFVIFSQETSSQSLGFVDAQAAVFSLNVAGHDLTIQQSRGLLTSDRKAGTTGAVVWKVTPLFASWISSPSNFLFTHKFISSDSHAIELGAGVSGIVGLALGPRISKYIATDQDYVLKLLRRNIAENIDAVLPRPKKTKSAIRPPNSTSGAQPSIVVQALDWETDDVSHLDDVDLVIACDCIYNESLIEPLNSTCAAICRSRQSQVKDLGSETVRPTLCIIAQQLRSPDVFEAWLKSFHKLFEVWRVPDQVLDDGLRDGSGFVVHIGIVRC